MEKLKHTTKFTDCLKIIAGNQSWVSVCPPYLQPIIVTGEQINTIVEPETEALPFVMLVHGPNIIYPSSIKSLPLETMATMS